MTKNGYLDFRTIFYILPKYLVPFICMIRINFLLLSVTMAECREFIWSGVLFESVWSRVMESCRLGQSSVSPSQNLNNWTDFNCLQGNSRMKRLERRESPLTLTAFCLERCAFFSSPTQFFTVTAGCFLHSNYYKRLLILRPSVRNFILNIFYTFLNLMSNKSVDVVFLTLYKEIIGHQNKNMHYRNWKAFKNSEEFQNIHII